MPTTSITVLAAGPQPQAGASDALDVSAFARIKLALQVSVDHGAVPAPALDFAIETSEHATGPWRPLFTRRYRASLPTSSESIASSTDRHAEGPFGGGRFALGDFDDFVRCTWREFGDQGLGGARRDPSLVLGLSGEAI